MNKDDWGGDIRPYDEYEDIRRKHRGRDDWDSDDEEGGDA